MAHIKIRSGRFINDHNVELPKDAATFATGESVEIELDERTQTFHVEIEGDGSFDNPLYLSR